MAASSRWETNAASVTATYAYYAVIDGSFQPMGDRSHCCHAGLFEAVIDGGFQPMGDGGLPCLTRPTERPQERRNRVAETSGTHHQSGTYATHARRARVMSLGYAPLDRPRPEVYTPPMTYAEIRAAASVAGAAVERDLLSRALAAHGWSVRATSRALDCSLAGLQRAVARHPDLAARAGGRPGRPKKTA